jgi:hypothetical protein
MFPGYPEGGGNLGRQGGTRMISVRKIGQVKRRRLDLSMILITCAVNRKDIYSYRIVQKRYEEILCEWLKC